MCLYPFVCMLIDFRRVLGYPKNGVLGYIQTHGSQPSRKQQLRDQADEASAF
jgi:hypothetical protein